MLNNLEDISSTKKRLNLVIPSADIDKEIQNSLNELRRRTNVPGFRQGKAPISLIRKRFGKEVESDAIERVIPKHYSEALKEAGIVPLGQPMLEGGIKYEPASDLSLTFTLEIRPTVENLNYDTLEVTDVPVDVNEDEVGNTLRRLAEERGTYEPTDEAAASGDVVIMDYTVQGNENPFTDDVLKLGTGFMPEAFDKALIGRRKSDAFEMEVEFPAEHHNKDFAGKKLAFKGAVKEVKKLSVPDIDDEFAKDLDFENLEELKGRIRERSEASKRATVAKIQRAELVARLIESHPMDAPEGLVEGELENLLAQLRGRQNAENMAEPDEKTMSELRQRASRHVKASILLQIIGEKEEVEVTEDDLKNRIMDLSAGINLTPENVIKYYMARDGSLEGLRQSVFEDKVMDMLLDRAKKVEAKKE